MYYVLEHFESNYAVVSEQFINEDEFQEMNDVNVWWGKGKHSRLFPAILIHCGKLNYIELNLQFTTCLSDRNCMHMNMTIIYT